MSRENTPQTNGSIAGQDDVTDATKTVRLPAFQTLLASLSTPSTLRYRLSVSPSIGNSPSCTSSSHRTLSPPISASSEDPVPSGTHSDANSDGIETGRDIEQTTHQVAQWIEGYNTANCDFPINERSGPNDSLFDDVDMASPSNQTAGEIGASEDLANQHAAALPNHALPPLTGDRSKNAAPFRAEIRPLTVRPAKSAFPIPPESPQDDRPQRLAASSSRSISPQAVSPEPQSGLASIFFMKLAQMPCACSICQRSGNLIPHGQVNVPGAQTTSCDSVPYDNDGMRLQYSSGSPPAGPSHGVTQYNTVTMKVAPAPALSSGLAPRGRPPRVSPSDQFHSFWVNDVRPLVWHEYDPPGQKVQQERPRPRGAKRKCSSDSQPAARKKHSSGGSSTSNSSTRRLSPGDTGEWLTTDLDDGKEAGAQKRMGGSKDNRTEPVEHARSHPVGSQNNNNNQQTNLPPAEQFSGLPWYAVPRPSDIYMTVDSKPAANVEGMSSDTRASKERVVADERKQRQQACGVQLEGAPDSKAGDHEGQSESNKTSDGLPWYAHRRSTDVYISVD